MAPKVELRHITHDTPTRNRRSRRLGEPASFACLGERSAMAHVSVNVPAGLTASVRETVVLLYRAAAEALELALETEGGAPGEATAHRARLAQLGDLLDQLGPSGEPPPGGVEVSAAADVLRDALYGALIDAGERLAAACSGGWREEQAAGSVRSAAREVIALDRLLWRIEAERTR
ncbi:MAG: hypothetical protein QOH58_3610 [Thermoleophilaceae bacterium]|jgi:hypothetical protein|nr:hypothetical protein [Thermoleophilaceae bacterium]